MTPRSRTRVANWCAVFAHTFVTTTPNSRLTPADVEHAPDER